MGNKINSILPVFLQLDEPMPDNLEDGILYISRHHKTAIHNCACGCGIQVVTPLTKGEWILLNNDDKVSLQPSIGNWKSENNHPYHAHYFITDNEIKWC